MTHSIRIIIVYERLTTNHDARTVGRREYKLLFLYFYLCVWLNLNVLPCFFCANPATTSFKSVRDLCHVDNGKWCSVVARREGKQCERTRRLSFRLERVERA